MTSRVVILGASYGGCAAVQSLEEERSAASRHYCQRISYRVQKLKVTKLVDTAS